MIFFKFIIYFFASLALLNSSAIFAEEISGLPVGTIFEFKIMSLPCLPKREKRLSHRVRNGRDEDRKEREHRGQCNKLMPYRCRQPW